MRKILKAKALFSPSSVEYFMVVSFEEVQGSVSALQRKIKEFVVRSLRREVYLLLLMK